MKTTLNLTNEEGLELLNALKNVAIGCGWNEDELAESGVMEEYAAVVEAAFAALNIHVLIESEPEDDDNEDFNLDNLVDFDDEDEEYTLTSKSEFVIHFMDEGHSIEETCKVADELFGKDE